MLCGSHNIFLFSRFFFLLLLSNNLLLLPHALSEATKLGHKHLCVNGHKSYELVWSQRSRRGHRATGVKRSFQLKCFFSHILLSMIIRTMHMNKSYMPYKTYGFKCRLEVIRGHRGQIQRSNFKQRRSAKLTIPTCWPWVNIQKYPRWSLCQTFT